MLSGWLSRGRRGGEPGGAGAKLDCVLVANRGEIAVRLVRGVQALGLRAVAVYSAADAGALHVRVADAAERLGEGGGVYTDVGALVAAGVRQGCGAVLPGYGFMSENPAAARAFEDVGIAWAGPAPETVERFGGKISARGRAVAAGVPVVPGTGVVSGVEEAVVAVRKVGVPALLKASAGGGGMGQVVVRSVEEVERGYGAVVAQAEALFGDGSVYVEKYVRNARHVEVQVFGNGRGDVVALGERDCSVQRRRQKVLEEGPAPRLDAAVRDGMRTAAVKLCVRERYRSAGTVEFIVDADEGAWYFLEVNTRLQVEHGVTELTSGVDIVAWMVRLAAGEDVLEGGSVALKERGYAMESRVYAENPVKDYAPCPGRLTEMVWPEPGVDPATGSVVRVDSWAERGTDVSGLYDPLLGKVLTWGRTRALALRAMRAALRGTRVRGVPCNVELLEQVCEEPAFVEGAYTTGLLAGMRLGARSVEVLQPGLQSSLQDYPGRVGYWDIGVSPSGAMDVYAMNMANALVGNAGDACAMEVTVKGPVLKFHEDAVVALCGARMEAEVDDGKPVPWWTPFQVDAGSVLTIGGVCDKAEGEGSADGPLAVRLGGKLAYLAVAGGFDAPKYLGSAATFPTGSFGGIHGGFLRAGDFIPVGASGTAFGGWDVGQCLPEWLIPRYDGGVVVVGAINGPHGSEDFLQSESLNDIWTQEYRVHHAANRLGIRLIGPTPKWTRTDGGSAGLHPSNLHDYTYAPGAVNFSGNTPIVLAVDGPSLGGFVCPITVCSAEMWKVTQAPAGSIVRFKQVGYDDARLAMARFREAWDAVRLNDCDGVASLGDEWSPHWVGDATAVDIPAIAAELVPEEGGEAEIRVVYRMSGDEHVLIEYGDIKLDLAYRMRVHMLMEELRPREYIKELCPGVRSVLVKYDPEQMHVSKLLDLFKSLELGVLGSVDDVVVPSRLIRLPLAFDDKWNQDAQERYLRSVRPDAPYMPSNVEFVRRINGLESTNDVKDIMTSCEYLVLGLGDVYLGAPCAVPVDPRHRLVTSKYNPARTYTPEGAVGIGGAFMCIYGMDSPGGYQLCGRTLPIWDNYGSVPLEQRGSPPEVPWLLRFFDRVSYFPVTDDELEEMRSQYRRGNLKIEISEEEFAFKDYVAFCDSNKESIDSFQTAQETAFEEERARWEESGEGESNAAAKHAAGGSGSVDDEALSSATALKRPEFSVGVFAGVSASVWAVEVADGQEVEQGTALFVLESMKVELTVAAPVSGIVRVISAKRGDLVNPDSELCFVESSGESAVSKLDVEHLRGMYKLGLLEPETVCEGLLICPVARDVLVSRPPSGSYSSKFETMKSLRRNVHLPLYGIPFVVSDDVHVSGMRTSAGCADFSFDAPVSATIVSALEKKGAILVGKANMDQFRSGVTGVESSFGIPENPSAPGAVSGGASGSALAVAGGLATFAVCVDSCGSAIVSAGLVEGVLCLKLSPGLFDLSGVVPACPAYDSLAIYAKTGEDLHAVMRSLNPDKMPESVASLKVGVPKNSDLVFSGKDAAESEEKFHHAIYNLSTLGSEPVSIDFSCFAKVTTAFEEVPLDALRSQLISDALHHQEVQTLALPSVARTIMRGASASAIALSSALEVVREATGAADSIWSEVDVIAVPSVPGKPTIVETQQDVEAASKDLSRYASFISVMGLCSMSAQGITFVSPARRESVLIDLAKRMS